MDVIGGYLNRSQQWHDQLAKLPLFSKAWIAAYSAEKRDLATFRTDNKVPALSMDAATLLSRLGLDKERNWGGLTPQEQKIADYWNKQTINVKITGTTIDMNGSADLKQVLKMGSQLQGEAKQQWLENLRAFWWKGVLQVGEACRKSLAATYGKWGSKAGVYTPANKSGAILAYAATFAGTPYLWGGKTPAAGFDCSGYTAYVYSHFGIDIGSGTQNQQHAGMPVSTQPKAWQPGDLIFYNTHDGQPSPSHVAIYAGNGLIWQAPHTGASVEKVSWTEPGTDVVAVRRVLLGKSGGPIQGESLTSNDGKAMLASFETFCGQLAQLDVRVGGGQFADEWKRYNTKHNIARAIIDPSRF